MARNKLYPGFTLKPQIKRVRTSPLGPSFESLDDITESPPPSSSSCIETSYDAHCKPHVLPQSLPSFKKTDSTLTIISDNEDTTNNNTSHNTVNTMKSPKLCILAEKGVFESTRTSRSETLQRQVEPNLGNSSLPSLSTSGVRGKRNGKERDDDNVPVDCLIEDDTPTDKSHLKQQHRNPYIKPMTDIFTEANKKRRPILLTASKRPKQQDSDEEFVPQQSQWIKRKKSQNPKSSTGIKKENLRRHPLRFYAKSHEDSTEFLRQAKKPRLKSANAPPKPGSSIENPMCLDDEVECDREEPVSSIKPVLPKLKRTLRSNTTAPALSDPSDWNVIDLLNDTSEIQFGNVTLLPVNVEVDSKGLTLALEYKNQTVQLDLRYNELTSIKLNLSTTPMVIVLYLNVLSFKRTSTKVEAGLKLKNLMTTEESRHFVLLKLNRKLDDITICNMKEFIVNKGPHLEEISSQEAQSLLDIATTTPEENEYFEVEDNENPLVDLPVDEIHRPQTRSLTKPSNTRPVTLIHVVPKLDIPGDELVLSYKPNVSRTVLSITGSDLECLQEGEYLNDNIINFYLLYLWNDLEDKRDDVHIFNSFFYSRLLDPRKDDVNVKNTPERLHVRVKSWTKSINIFEKKMILVPVCYRAHWFLAVIVSPGSYDPDCIIQKPPTTNNTNKRKRRKRLSTKRIKKPNIVTLNEVTEGVELQEKEVEAKGVEPQEKEVEPKGVDPEEVELLMKQEEPELKNDVHTVLIEEEELLGNSDESSLMEVEMKTPNIDVIEESQPLEEGGVACDNINSEANLVTSSTPDIELINSSSTPSLNDSTSSLVHDESSEHQSIRPCILVLDSMLVRRRGVGANLKKYLTHEYRSKYSTERDFSKLPIDCPAAPGQNNSYDCGVYLLTYTEQLFKFYKEKNHLPEGDQWAPDDIIANKRLAIQKLITSQSSHPLLQSTSSSS